MLTFLHCETTLESRPLLLHWRVSLQVVDILTQPACDKKPSKAISCLSLHKRRAQVPFHLTGIYSILRKLLLTKKEEKKTHHFVMFLFQQINQMPLITQMTEIKLFAEWYTVLINYNLHRMSLELIFLLLIYWNLAGGSDWINSSCFSFSAMWQWSWVLHTQQGHCLQPASKGKLLDLRSEPTKDTYKGGIKDRL